MAALKISQFINKALFDQQQGYYKTKNPIGKNSDFITSSEISQIFGEIVAVYLLQIFATKNCAISFVEMGAGKGTWFFDILCAIKKLAEKKVPIAVDFISKTSLHIIEINPVLKNIQQEKLQNFTINWHEDFDEFLLKKPKSEIFFISNELFDCFAIDQYVLTELGWRERLIDVENKVFTLDFFNKKTNEFVKNNLGKNDIFAPLGAVFEYSESARNFMKILCEALKKHGGMAINIDYGYFKNIFANSFQAVKNHKKISVFDSVGESDLTSHVDFCALDEIAKNCGLNSSFVSQREFLISLGILERKERLIIENLRVKHEIDLAVERLIGVNLMGEIFKVHIIWS